MSGGAVAGAPALRPSRRRRAPGLHAVLLAAVMSAACATALSRLETPAGAGVRGEKLYLPSGLFLRQAALGFREPGADWLWFQAVQYYGGYRLGRHGLEYFRGLMHNVTRLDTHFLEAYRFGALVIATDMGDVAGGIDLLKRGVLANPGRWILPFEIGFLHYAIQRDYARAAVWFEAAARAPDATDFARRFAAFARGRAGQVEVSLLLWRNLRDTTASPDMRDLAERMIAKCEEEMRQTRAAAPAPARAEGVERD